MGGWADRSQPPPRARARRRAALVSSKPPLTLPLLSEPTQAAATQPLSTSSTAHAHARALLLPEAEATTAQTPTPSFPEPSLFALPPRQSPPLKNRASPKMPAVSTSSARIWSSLGRGLHWPCAGLWTPKAGARTKRSSSRAPLLLRPPPASSPLPRTQDFEPFRAKMAAEGLSEAAIGAFKHNYEQMAAGVTGMVRFAIGFCAGAERERRSVLCPPPCPSLSLPQLSLSCPRVLARARSVAGACCCGRGGGDLHG